MSSDLKDGLKLGSDNSAKARASVPAGPAVDIVRDGLQKCRSAFIGVGSFSCILNILMLAGPLFMMQVYDRVLTSGSIPTLVALLLLVTMLYLFYGLFDLIRSRVLIKVGLYLDQQFSQTVFQTVLGQQLRSRTDDQSSAPIRDMDTLRQFLSGPGPLAIFDMPWTPLYLAVIFMFHPILGFIALAGVISLFTLALISEVSSRRLMGEAAGLATQRSDMASSSRRNAEAAQAMGMNGQLGRLWDDLNSAYLDVQGKASSRTSVLAAITRSLRLFMQSAILAAGAWLAIKQEVTPGTIIAGSIVMSRALAPIELAVANWRGFVSARQSAQRLKATLGHFLPVEKTALAEPTESLAAKSVTVSPPGSSRIAVERVSFELRAGEALGIIGPSASGKSTLARALIGVWPMVIGEVRIDGATLDQWDSAKLGRHIGYLPQTVDLFRGTVAENIARFDPERSAGQVIEAANMAGVHEMILNLPDGYDTEIGESGSVLSIGQRQRIGLARALYGRPFLIVLDEPNSNLDPEGEAALTRAIGTMRTNGSVVIVVAHRPSAISAVSHILVLNGGKQQAFGPREKFEQARAAASGLTTSQQHTTGGQSNVAVSA